MSLRGRVLSFAAWLLFGTPAPIVVGFGEQLQKQVNWTFVDTFLTETSLKYGFGLGIENALKCSGVLTEDRLLSVFDKCSTPNAVITVAAVGGSITAHWTTAYDSNYVSRFAKDLRKACPNAKVKVVNSARGSTGSLTTSLCLNALVGSAPDILFTEFALNDENMYGLSTDPYELLYRTALSDAAFAGSTPPAAIAIIFWGYGFGYKSAQEPQLEVLRHYSCTGISIRDLIWPFVTSGTAPYATKEDVCIDAHHPTVEVHRHTGDLVAQYVFRLFKSWQKEPRVVLTQLREGYAAASSRVHLKVQKGFKFALPKPINPTLAAFGGAMGGAQCAICGGPKAAGASDPELFEAHGWNLTAGGKADENRKDRQKCVELQAVSAEGFYKVTLEKGYVFLSNCLNHQGIAAHLRLRSYDVELVVTHATQANVAGAKRKRLNLVPVLAGVGELFHNDPPLPPGSYTLAIVASDAAKASWKAIKPQLGSSFVGFGAIVTL